MEKTLYFVCECGGKAKMKVCDLADEENVFDVEILGQTIFKCEDCGKKYYTGDWEEFCISEDNL